MDLSKQPVLDFGARGMRFQVEKLFRLLYYELSKLAWSSKSMAISYGRTGAGRNGGSASRSSVPWLRRDRSRALEMDSKDMPCPDRLLAMSQESKQLAEEVNQLHLNTTGEARLEFGWEEVRRGSIGHFTSTLRSMVSMIFN